MRISKTVFIFAIFICVLDGLVFCAPFGGHKLYDEMWVRDVTIDNEGNVFVCGRKYKGKSMVMLTKKYSVKAEQCWEQEYDGGIHEASWPDVLAVGNDGSVYVAGRVKTREKKKAMDEALLSRVIIKYNRAGDEEWVSLWQEPEVIFSAAEKITVGLNTVCILGDCYIRKYYRARHRFYQMLFYDTGGKEVRVVKHEKNDKGISFVDHPILGDDDSLYYTEYYDNYPAEKIDYEDVLVKRDNKHNIVWRRDKKKYDYFPEFMSCFFWSNDALYFSGYVSASDESGPLKLVTIKIDPSGNLVWKDSGQICNGMNAEPYEIIVDKSGCVYVAGWSFTVYPESTLEAMVSDLDQDEGCKIGSVGDDDMDSSIARSLVLAKYDPLGNRLWLSTIETGKDFDFLESIGLVKGKKGDITYYCLVEAEKDVAHIHAIRSTDSGKFILNKEFNSMSELLNEAMK